MLLRRLIPSARALLLTLLLTASSVAAPSAFAQEKEVPRPPGAIYEVDLDDEEIPSYLERTVEFMWLEDGRMWKDRFRARLYPREPVVNERSRINLLIRRYRDSYLRGKANPLRTEIFIRRANSGKPVKQVIERPGTSISFDYRFTHTGQYSVRLVTYYSDIETYTVTLHFSVSLPKPDEKD